MYLYHGVKYLLDLFKVNMELWVKIVYIYKTISKTSNEKVKLKGSNNIRKYKIINIVLMIIQWNLSKSNPWINRNPA